jgi:hypothetical protein
VAAVVLLVLPLAGRLAPHFRNESRTSKRGHEPMS